MIPLRADSTLQLAWGLTLNFSHEDKEVAVGNSLLQEFQNLRMRFKDAPKTLEYLDNLTSIIGSYLRTAGFERDVYVSYLDIFKETRDTRLKNIDDVSELASFSSGSFILRFAAFLGLGTLADVLGSFGGIAKPTPGLPFDLSFFLLFGLGGVVAFTFSVRLLKERFVAGAINHSFEEQLEFWESFARPAFKRELKHLAQQLKIIIAKYYPSYSEDLLANENALDSLLESILPDKHLYEIVKPRRKRGMLDRIKSLFRRVTRLELKRALSQA